MPSIGTVSTTAECLRTDFNILGDKKKIRGGCSTPRSGRFTHRNGKRHPLYRKMDGPQDRIGRLQNTSPPPKFELITEMPVVRSFIRRHSVGFLIISINLLLSHRNTIKAYNHQQPSMFRYTFRSFLDHFQANMFQ